MRDIRLVVVVPSYEMNRTRQRVTFPRQMWKSPEIANLYNGLDILGDLRYQIDQFPDAAVHVTDHRNHTILPFKEVPHPGFEPRLTVPKTVVLSVTPMRRVPSPGVEPRPRSP